MEPKKIKLNKLSDDALAQRQMKELKGGSVIERHCNALVHMPMQEAQVQMITWPLTID